MIHYIHRMLKLDGIVSRFFFWVIMIVFFTSFSYLITYSAVDKKAKLEEVEANLQYGLQNQIITLENWSADREEEVFLLAGYLVTPDANYEVMATRFNYFANHFEQLNSIVYIDKDGSVILDTAYDGTILKDQHVDVSDREYFKLAKAGRKVVYQIIEKKSTGDATVIFSAPVLTKDNKFNGVILTAVHLDKIIELLSETIQGETGQITFANNKGEVILKLTKDMSQTFITEVEPNRIDSGLLHHIAKEAYVGFVEYKDEMNKAKYSSFAPLLNDQFILINEIDKQEVLAPHNRMVTIMFMIKMLIIIGAFLLFYPVTQRLLQPFHHLVFAINRMKKGRYNTQLDAENFKTSPRELRQMMHVFNEMATAIQENKELLKTLSNTDGLTGVANRRLFEESFSDKWESCLQEGQPMSLLFIDIDFFKKYNDSFGHQKGDACLIKIAQELDGVVDKPNEFVARYGGEEFVITLPNTASEKAAKVAKKVQKRIKQLRIQRTPTDNEKYVTVSIGVATLIPTPSNTKEMLIQIADQALYDAKSQGRNKIIVRDE